MGERRGNIFRAASVLVLIVAMVAALVATDIRPSAAAPPGPGSLDPAYGTNGVTTVAVPGGFAPGDVTAVDGAGRLVVIGTTNTSPKSSVIARFTADGHLDATFGTNGMIVHRFSSTGDDAADGVAILPTGEVVRAVQINTTGLTSNWRVVVQKLDADGTPLNSALLGDGTIVPGLSGGATGGEVVVTPDGKVVVTGSHPTPSRDFGEYFAVKLNTDLTVDHGYGVNGLAIANFNGNRAVAYGATIDSAGRVLIGGENGPNHWASLARFTPAGALDSTFGNQPGYHGTGFEEWTPDGCTDSWARTTVVRNDGVIFTGGYGFCGRGSYITALNDDGSFVAGFGTNGVYNQGSPGVVSLAVDAQDRVVAGLDGPSVGRLQVAASPPDTSFGTGGNAPVPCAGTGGISSVNVVDLTRIVAFGFCNGAILVARLRGESAAWSGLSLSMTPASPDAGRAETPLAGLDPLQLLAGGAALASSPLRGSPLRGSPLRGSPLRGSPLRGSPLRGSPLRGSPLRGSPLAVPLPLSSIPLVQDVPTDPTWETVLKGTPFEGVPLQNITLQQVIDGTAGMSPDPLANVTLAAIDLSNTPLRGSSLAAILLGQVPLAALPAPPAGWCPFLSSQDVNCASTALAGFDPATWTLLDLEIAGADLHAYYAQPIPLTPGVLSGTGPGGTSYESTIAQVHAHDVWLSSTPFGALPSSVDGGDLVTCGSACPATLGETQTLNADDIVDGPTVADLIAALPAGQTLTLGEVVAGLVRPEDLPVEDLPLAPVLDAATMPRPAGATVTVSFALECSAPTRPSLSVDLPAGSREDGAVTLADATASTSQTLPAGGTADHVVLGTINTCAADTAAHAITLSIPFDPPVRLGPMAASALMATTADEEVVSVGGASASDAHEPSDDNTPTAIAPETVYTGHLGHAGDVDLYHLDAPPAGSSLSISLSHLPADYDLVVYGDGDSLTASPLRGSPLRGSPLRGSPVGDNVNEAGTSSTDQPAEGLADIPLRGSPLRGSSINRGTDAESVTVLSRTTDQASGFTVQVSGFDGAHSDDPYVLRARVIPGPAPAPCPAPRTFPSVGVAGTFPAVSSATQTLILVDQKRMGDLYGAAAVTPMMATLEQLASAPGVAGAVVPVEAEPAGGWSDVDVAGAYAAWDADPCSVAAANGVVTEINKVVDKLRPQLTDLRHIVLVGSDVAIPQARIPDLTGLSNQTDYTDSVRYGGTDNEISRAFLEGNILSDEPYGDFDPQPWIGGKLYVADVGLGRLVETPAEIAAAAQQYIDHGGHLQPSTGFVAGYDFLSDGATDVLGSVTAATSKSANPSVTSRIDETWTKTDAANGIAATSANGLTSVNAHYDHYQALPAAPFNAGTTADDQLLSTADLPATFDRTLLFTMGCEAGLNVPDVLVQAPLTADETASLADWAQTVTSRGGLFAGNTGYGYGDTDSVAYSERVMAYFAGNIAAGTSSIGQSLMFAKQRYNGELGVAGVYDAKAMEEATFYGLPMWTIGPSGTTAPSVVPPVADAPPSSPSVATAPLDESVHNVMVQGPHGTHWEADGQAPQVTQYRPVEPRTQTSYAETDGLRIHGVVLTDLTSTDINDVDPAYATPTIDLGANEPEARTTASVFPAALQAVNTVETQAGPRDVVVLMPGQFFAGQDGSGKGTQRLYSHMAGTIYRSNSNDFDAPTITQVSAVESGAGTVGITVHSPSTDVTRAVALYRTGTDSTVDPSWHEVDLSGGGGAWNTTVTLPAGSTKVVDLIVQLVDGAGNVGISSNKGPGYRSEVASAGNVTLSVAGEKSASGWYTEPPTVTVEAPASDAVTVTVDGVPVTPSAAASAPGSIAEQIVLTTAGRHDVIATASNGTSAELVVLVDLAPPVVTISNPLDGAEYVVGQAIGQPQYACTDDVGVTSCTASASTLDGSVGTHTLSVTGADAAGRVTTATAAYSVRYGWNGFLPPIVDQPSDSPDGAKMYKAGSTIPVKFALHAADGSVIPAASAPEWLVPVQTTASAPPPTAASAVSTGGLFKLDPSSDQYSFEWKTGKQMAGFWWIGVRLADGTSHYVRIELR
jgi:uncharacterized delta-60 repeat protein